MDETDSIKHAIAALEAQRPLLGDAVVDTALAPLREKLELLQPRPSAEQRKLVTVLFADLVGFTAFSEHMDPEDVREIVNAYFTRWTTCIERCGGVVEKFIGDAVMAVFGLSTSREDDPESAVRAALEMRQALVELNNKNRESWGHQLEMRVGIHTGTVMVSFLGERKGQDFVVVGDTVNLASRLQSVAPSGGILISHDTFRHVRGSFDVQILNPVKVKGKEEPIQAYQVIQARRRSFRGPTRGVEGIETSLVGRDDELAQLKDTLLSAVDTRKTQVVMVIGEAGVGKSRLIAEFDGWVELLPQSIRYLKGRASPSMQNLPYSLLRDLLSFSFDIYDSDSPQVVQEKIENRIGEFEYSGSTNLGMPAETQMRAHFIGHLLGFRFENSPYLPAALLEPLIFWNRAQAYLVDYFKALVSTAPVALLLEDIHWADENSLETLQRIWKRLSDEPLLVVCTARPALFENHPAWGKDKVAGKVVFTLIHLASLSQENSQHLVNEILNKVEHIPEFLRDLVVNRAEGNPFFIEELIKMLIEEQVILKEGQRWRVELANLEGVHIPSTLVEVLQARLDGLSPEERLLLQRASVLGRVFWDDAISFMEKGQEDQVQISHQLIEILKHLGAREMVFSHPSSTFEDTNEFFFKHVLLRDVTYDNVLKRLRRIYHGYAAAWLETTTGQSRRSGEYAALIAEHYELANDWDKARAWYQRAADQAAGTYANAESVRCLTRCLELWPEQDISGKFPILIKRARLHDMTANRPAQKQDLETLQALAEKLDAQEGSVDQPGVSHRAEAFLQWWHFYDAVSDLKAATAAARHAITLAQASGDRESEMLGNLYLGSTNWMQSNYPAAQEYLQKALVLARLTSSRTMEADSLRNLGIVLQYQGNFPEARTHYEEAMRIYYDSGSERGESMALNSLGSLLIEQGQYREALPYFERSLELKRKIGHRRAEHITLHNLGILAYKLGNFSDALTNLEKVQRFGVETGDRNDEADALNMLGSVALQMGDFARAKTCLENALDLAREIGSKVIHCEVLASLALLAYYLGNPQAAYQNSQDSLAMARDLNLPDPQAASLVYSAQAALDLGRMDEAAGYYRDALELVRQNSDASRVVEIQAGLAAACLAQGNHTQALELIEDILHRLAIENQVDSQSAFHIRYTQLEGINGPFQVLLSCYQVLHASHDQRAEPLLRAAFSLLLEQSRRLPSGSAQSDYLENIPAHRELRRLFDQLAAGPGGGAL
jgi:class 3 adenylate cyclase/tetratricopeptide (TPR) repeat protein